MDEKKILVAAPTYEGMKYCQEEFFNRIKNLSYSNYDILIIDNTRGEDYFKELSKIEGIKVIHDNTTEDRNIFRLISSRNKILEYAIENNYTHIMMFDVDVIPPINIIKELLECDKEIVSGLYHNYFNADKKVKYLPVSWKHLTEKEFEEIITKYRLPEIIKKRTDLRRHLTKQEVESNELHKVAFPSAGCMLIRKEVFEKVRYGLLEKPGFNIKAGDDIYFIIKAREFGFTPYCHTKLKCEHRVLEKYEKDENGNLVNKGFK